MGSSISAIDDKLRDEQHDEDKKWLNEQADKIRDVNPWSMEFEDIKWLLKNKDKIIKQRRLIDIIS